MYFGSLKLGCYRWKMYTLCRRRCGRIFSNADPSSNLHPQLYHNFRLGSDGDFYSIVYWWPWLRVWVCCFWCTKESGFDYTASLRLYVNSYILYLDNGQKLLWFEIAPPYFRMIGICLPQGWWLATRTAHF